MRDGPSGKHTRTMVVDALQFIAPSRARFEEMRAGGVDAVHVTVSYHEGLRDTIRALAAWNRHFEDHGDLILRATSTADIDRARETGRTAILFGAQTPAPIEDDLGLIEILHQLGLRFLQPSYNTQSLLCAGCYEAEDAGLTLYGREAVAEMNRVGLVIDLSHTATRSQLEIVEASTRPVAITHANPARWHDHPRNTDDAVMDAVVAGGGMAGFSLYPLHLAGGSECTRDAFLRMVAETAERWGTAALGFGSDLCQGQPDAAVRWMRDGRWRKHGRGGGFPAQPTWFRSNADFPALADGLRGVGFDAAEVAAIMGGNWERFMADAFAPAEAP
ncbi:MAG: membrane dipeptidase [Shimia sp.]